MTTATTASRGIHIISLLVRNKPGVLVRIALVFARRGYNIESLVVSPTMDAEFSRMTITCSGDLATLEQIIKQCAKLIDVVQATDHTDHDAIEAEIVLVKLRVPLKDRTEVLQIAEHYKAAVVDFGPESLVIRAYGESDKLDSFLDLMRRYPIVEVVRSGSILVTRGAQPT